MQFIKANLSSQIYYRHLMEQDHSLELIQPVTGTNIYTKFLERRDGDGLHHVKEWVEDCQKELLEYKKRGIEVLQSGKFDEDEHYYLDTESIFGFMYEIGNNGRIRPPERRFG
jgi:methylmalonyl-CoA/ethylmalonyl-CoA epimerase